MNPPDAHSSLAALRQLKEMLDAGTVTPDEFETLKRQLIFGQEPALPLAPPAESPAAEVPAPALASVPTPEAPAPLPETTLAAYETAAPNPAELAPPPPAATPDWPATAAPGGLPAEEFEPAPAGERANPLNLLFAIGGTLVFLGAIIYLMMGRPDAPDEHLTTGSQTAADSTVVLPETGPQAEQLNLPPVAPETVRVAPVMRPAPAAGQFRADSAGTAPAPAAPAPKPVMTPTAPAAAPADSVATKAP